MTTTYAHSRSDRPREDWHLLEDHLQKVARLARERAAVFNASQWGEYAGWLHDLGKATRAFQNYLLQSAEGEGVRGSVPHSVHGARLAVDRDKALGRLLAYVIAGHHGGLPDWDDLERRLADAGNLEPPEFDAARIQPPEALPFVDTLGNSPGFILTFFTRMVFSCLVDADWLDTEAFMDPERGAWRGGYPSISTLSQRLSPKLEALCAEAEDTVVNTIRRTVLDDCLAAAEKAPGLFSLTVPTGGGKTLSSLAFAMRHAELHGLRRVIYVIPYMSIIEQNADVFRQYLGDDAVVEHHSSFDPGDDREEGNSEIRRAKLACENWDAPLIATTAVQFFESLFASKPSRCRKLHNLAKSIIILDEAQMLPRELLLPCLAAIRELALRYGASVVLCTATQPAINKREDFKAGLEGVREIVTDPTALHARLRRTTVQWLGTLDDQALAHRLAEHPQVLCIVNTRGHALELFQRLHGREGLAHLSANMTPEHRSEKIAQIKEALKSKAPCLVVSTQLVEAGVNLDFPVVYRAAAGLDSVAQAAGRCDREGRLTAAAGAPAGLVYVFTPEHGLPPGHFRITAGIAEGLFRLGYADILSLEAVEHYFRLLFWQAGDRLDAKGIIQDLSQGYRSGDFPFRSVAEKFRLIENDMRPLIVPRDDHVRSLAHKLKHVASPGRILRKLQRHMVQLRLRVWEQLVRDYAASCVLEGVAVLERADVYDDSLGIHLKNQEFYNDDVFIV